MALNQQHGGRISAAGLVQELEKEKAGFNVTHYECIKNGSCLLQFVRRTSKGSYKQGFVIGVDKETRMVCFVVEVTSGTEDYYNECEKSVKPNGCDHPDVLNRFEKFCLDSDCCKKE